MEISFDNILVRHWILFDYDVKDAYAKESVHYLFRVKDSIHYKSLVSGDYSDYNRLIETTNQREHSLESFLNLKEDFKVSNLPSNKITLHKHPSLNKYVVIDGVHRLSILMYNDIKDLSPDWFIVQQ